MRIYCSTFNGRLLSLVGALALMAGAAVAQNVPRPDCVIDVTLTAAGQTAGGAGTCGTNINGVYEWRLTYKSSGFTAISLLVQSAPPDAGGVCTAASWVAFAGTLVTGVNPNTAITNDSSSFKGFEPCVRVVLSSKVGTGTITGQLYGCRSPGCSISDESLSVTIPTPLPVDGPTAAGTPPTTPPVLIAGQDSVPNIRTIRTDSGGQPIVNQGTAAAPTAGWPVTSGQTASTTATWTDATPADTALAISTIGYGNVAFQFVKTGAITGGVVTFEGSIDGTNYVPISVVAAGFANNGTTTITLSTQSNNLWQMFVGGMTSFRLRLSTPITGAGSTATFSMVASTIGAEFQQIVAQASGLNLHVNADVLPGATTAQADGQTNSPMQPVASVAGTPTKTPTYPFKFNGATWDREYGCTSRTNIALAAGTDVVIATGVAATNAHLCMLVFSGATVADFTIRQGTGTTCLTNTLDLAGIGQVAGAVLDMKSNDSAMVTTVQARDMCLHVSASVTILGYALYATF